MRRRTIFGAIAVIGLALWWHSGGTSHATREVAAAAGHGAGRPAAADPDRAEPHRAARARPRGLAVMPGARDELVTISGRVVELTSGAPVGEVEVIARGARGETSATTSGDGAFVL